jgi:hypothetical protein
MPPDEGKEGSGDIAPLPVAALWADLAALDAQARALRLRRRAICEALEARGSARHAAWVSAATGAAAAHFGAPQPRLHALLSAGLTRLPRARRRTEVGKYYHPAWAVLELSYGWRGRLLRWEVWHNLCCETQHELYDAPARRPARAAESGARAGRCGRAVCAQNNGGGAGR